MQAATTPLRVLVGDDQTDVLEAIRLLLKGSGHQAEIVDSPGALLRVAGAKPFDVILMDMNYSRDTTSGEEGLELLDKLMLSGRTTPVIVMTAWSNVDLAVEAMRRGACDFVQKPWDNARLVSTVEKQARAAAERSQIAQQAKSELDIARLVQQRLLPQDARASATLDYAGLCIPAREVGGDYYDYLDSGDGRVGFVLADVSGKGIAGALLMANLQASFRSQIDLALRDPRGLLNLVNKQFHESTPTEFFCTLVFLQYEDATRKLRCVNCGHPSPILVRANGDVERVDASALPLGIFAAWQCSEQELTLAPGDTFLMFSDGVVEAGVETDDEFGEQRLIDFLRDNRTTPVSVLLDKLVTTVDAAARPGDDFTAVVLRAK